MADTTTTIRSVTGMTCEHCVNAVKSEVGAIDNVQGVEVDLEAGKVTVDSTGPLDEAAFAEAIDEAGFELAAS